MTARLWITPSIFRLSKAGVDVTTAGSYDQLMFDANFGSPARFIKGAIADSRSGSGTTTTVVPYGFVFTTVPIMLINFTPVAGGSFPGETYPIKNFNDSQTPWINMSFSWTRFKVNVYTDRVEFRFTSFSSSVTYVIDYLIFDYRLGF